MKFEIETQLSVTLKDELGQIANISEELSNAGFHIRSVSLDSGVMRLTTCDPIGSTEFLLGKGYDTQQEQIISIRLQDSKGRLAEITRLLASSGVNIDYVYATVDDEGASSRLILKVSNVPLASRILDEISKAA